MTDLHLPAGGLIVPFAEATILADVKLDVDVQGDLFMSLMGEPMVQVGKSSRTVFVDSTQTIVVKAEHSFRDLDYAVQCWNEYVYWGEYVQGTPEAELIVPTLELDVRPCPLFKHVPKWGPNPHTLECVVTLNLQEYINDGLADDVYVGAPEGHDPNPWDDCMRPLLRRRPELKTDVGKHRPDQARYCMDRGRYVLADYGLPASYGYSIESMYYESISAWRNERLEITNVLPGHMSYSAV